MREFEDYDDSLRNPDTLTHPLSTYSYANFFEEYPKTCVVIAAVFTVAVSMYIWKFCRIQLEERFDDIVRNGRFNQSMLQKLRRSNVEKNEQRSSVSNENKELLSAFKDVESFANCKESAEANFQKSFCSRSDHMTSTFGETYNSDKGETFASLGQLHGKLATAKLRAKAKKLEKAMSEEERKEERLVRQKQLESICEMIMQKPEKFGVHDKSEVMEQMKLYSF